MTTAELADRLSDFVTNPNISHVYSGTFMAAAAALRGQSKRLNAWRELGEEMARVVASLSAEQREDLLPDWFEPQLSRLRGQRDEEVR